MRFLFALLILFSALVRAENRPRLLVLTDIGGDPDDEQSMVRLMLYSNEFRIEGLIATSAGIRGQLETPVVRADLIHAIVNAYGEIASRLERHANAWPKTAELRRVIKSGNPQRGVEYIGEAHDTEGSRWIVERVDMGTPEEPLNISIWGGQTDFAQALWRVKHDRGEEGLAKFVQGFRVYDIGDQDGIAAWMQDRFPSMFYILSDAPAGEDRRLSTHRGMYLGGNESLTSLNWVENNVLQRGPLGKLYPTKTWTAPNPHSCLKEGDTPSWFFFLPIGGNDPADPTKPGWGGRYRRAADGWFRSLPKTESFDPRDTVSRWRPDYQNDFARRMEWSVK